MKNCKYCGVVPGTCVCQKCYEKYEDQAVEDSAENKREVAE